MEELLYTSADVRKAIVNLFRSSKGRRVAVSAFVGDGAQTCLPKPDGIELVCWPKEGGTNPDVIRRLAKTGVKIMFADALHMKIYWSEDKGAIVTSANLSNNALGSGGLKEIGVWLAPGKLDIDRIIESVEARPLTESELKQLDRRHKEYWVRNRGTISSKRRTRSFSEWLKLPFKPDWRLGWWDCAGAIAEEAKRISKEEYNVAEPTGFLSVRKEDYEENDWVLIFGIDKPSNVSWLYVNYIVKVDRTEKKAYSPEYPYQVVQVWKLKNYPSPPFRIDKRFKKAFSRAVKDFGPTRIKEMKSFKPPRRLLSLTEKHFHEV